MKQILRNTLTLLLGVFILVGVLYAENWHQWRGPNNDGISHETDVPIQWSQTENIKWRLPLPGEGCFYPLSFGKTKFSSRRLRGMLSF